MKVLPSLHLDSDVNTQPKKDLYWKESLKAGGPSETIDDFPEVLGLQDLRPWTEKE